MTSGVLHKPAVTADEAVERIQDGWMVAVGGSGPGHCIPETLLEALGRRYRRTGAPRRLGLTHAFGVGNQKDKGLIHLAQRGLFERVIAGHWSMSPSMARLAEAEEFAAYNLPSGILVQLYHAAAARSPGILSEVGLETFIDPRLEGGRLNRKAVEEVVRLVQVDGKDFLFYQAFPVHAALIVATSADPEGNLGMEDEVAPWHNLALAQAAKASGGITIAQVKRRVGCFAIDPRHVRVPGIFVDCVVVHPEQGQTYQIRYDPSLCGAARKPETEFGAFPLSLRKVIARRAAMELFPGALLNLGFGVPDGVVKVAREQGLAGAVVPSVEQGQIGGIPAEGMDFGASYNSAAIVETLHQFNFYHGRGVDLTFLGFAEIDAAGNVNVSRMGDSIVGTGGFIDISQRARKLVFCGTLAVKARIELEDGRPRVIQTGRPKMVERVGQVTFSGPRAVRNGQQVLYVTDLAVFRLTGDGVRLEEVAPGIDIELDVLAQMAFRPVVGNVETMPKELFREDPLPSSLFRHFVSAAGV